MKIPLDLVKIGCLSAILFLAASERAAHAIHEKGGRIAELEDKREGIVLSITSDLQSRLSMPDAAAPGSTAINEQKAGSGIFRGFNHLLNSITDTGRLPESIFSFIGNFYRYGEASKVSMITQTPEIHADVTAMFGSGVGYHLTRHLRFEYIGIFDPDERSLFLGPSLRFRFFDDADLTAGVQVPSSIPDNALQEYSDFYFAELKLYF